ncbi:MAG: GntR family transcriptional regulator [Paracoccus sp. (in: a-proteobacteria)]|nr:GntR family transcriptional regulator [Paracoccus sp. (in: a-proteobacteria)]
MTARRIADLLRDRIVREILPPGSRLIEREISQELGVSRTPVREAIKELAAEGLVDLRPNRGAEVATFDPRRAEDLFEVLAELEALAVRRFVHRMTVASLQELEHLHGELARHFHARELERYFTANTAIHDLLIREAGNAILAETHQRLLTRSRLGRHMAIAGDHARWAESLDEHEHLLIAVRRHDAEAAAAIWRRHLRNSGRTLAAASQAHGDGSVPAVREDGLPAVGPAANG